MIRIILFLVLLAGLAAGVGWVADRPGQITVTWLGHVIETDVLTGLVAALVLVVALLMVVAILRWLISAPAKARRASRERRARKGQEAVTRGILAIGAGDRRAAEKHAYDAERLAPDAPLTLLLKAQTAQLAGDRSGAESAFRAMLDKPETKVLGLRGLHVEAQRRQDPMAARAIAEEAVKTAPSAHWASEAVLQQQSLAGEWDEALATVERQAGARLIDKDMAKRQRAVLLTAKAMSLEATDPTKAKALAQEAHGLAPSLVPAAALYGRLAGADGEIRRASKALEKTWGLNPHPDLAEAYADARPGDSARDKLKRVENLASQKPGDPESSLTVARYAIAANAFDVAAKALEPLASTMPSQRACLAMAELVAKESGDTGRAREWMARALRAPRDAAWTADGQVSDHWLPISPLSGRLDAFEWKVPVAELGGPVLHVDDVLADVAEPAIPMIEVEAVPATPPAAAVPPMGAPAKAEPAKAEPVKAEPVKAEPVKAEPVKAGSLAPTPAAMAAAPAPVTPAPEPAKSESTAPKADAAKVETATQTAPKAIAATNDPARSEILDIATPKPTPVLPLPRAPDDPGPPQDTAEPPEKKRFTLFGR